MNFSLLFWGAKFFPNGYLAYFLSEHDKNRQGYGSGQSTLIPLFLSTLFRGSHGTMQRHPSVLNRCTCFTVFDWLFYCFIFLGSPLISYTFIGRGANWGTEGFGPFSTGNTAPRTPVCKKIPPWGLHGKPTRIWSFVVLCIVHFSNIQKVWFVPQSIHAKVFINQKYPACTVAHLWKEVSSCYIKNVLLDSSLFDTEYM